MQKKFLLIAALFIFGGIKGEIKWESGELEILHTGY